MDILCRHASDDFDAFTIAQRMEAAGATVFSITFNGYDQPDRLRAPHPQFIVWARFTAPLTPDLIDLIDADPATQ